MTKHRRRTWVLFAGTALVLFTVVLWLTMTLRSIDRNEVISRRNVELQQRLRLALWRMDSWLAAPIAREALRPAAAYRKRAPAIADGDPNTIVPTQLFPLYFELDAQGKLTSPQTAPGALPGEGATAADPLQALRSRLDFAAVSCRLAAVAKSFPVLQPSVSARPDAQIMQNVAEYGSRQAAYSQNRSQGALLNPPSLPVADPSPVGSLIPVWLDGEPLRLLFVREVLGGGVSRIQGFVVDWPTLQKELLALVTDLFPGEAPKLLRAEGTTAEEQGAMLASVPARLDARLPADVFTSSLPTTMVLWITWGITLLSLGALGFTLRAAIGYGDRRARFASAVTHELRTPLTTFRMYSEMLADGVVKDPKAQHEYLDTLRRESDRLSRVVENVLAWSRLEQGRFASRRERHRLGALVERMAPALRQRLAEADLEFEVHWSPGGDAVVLETDEDAIGQILFNLVDNAAKYARGAADRQVLLTIRCDMHLVRIELRDHGPGIPAAVQKRIFAPFDRGALPTASNDVPGVGLGLALARGLATDLGGALECVAVEGQGACFRLTLPAL